MNYFRWVGGTHAVFSPIKVLTKNAYYRLVKISRAGRSNYTRVLKSCIITTRASPWRNQFIRVGKSQRKKKKERKYHRPRSFATIASLRKRMFVRSFSRVVKISNIYREYIDFATYDRNNKCYRGPRVYWNLFTNATLPNVFQIVFFFS